MTDVMLRNMANAINDALHKPVLEWLVPYCVWSIHLLFGPIYLLAYLALAIVDLVAGNVWWRYEEPSDERPIVISGCDTGFGHELALALAEKGWKVYAGCLTDKGMAQLTDKRPNEHLVAVKLDVTKADDIKALVDKVEAENPEGVFALVNNAGVGSGGLVDWATMEDFRFIMEVNYFSIIAMCKAFLPLLKKRPRARIVNLSSMAGLFPGMVAMSGYSASKHAAEAFSTSLRLELHGWGIKVSTINPTFHRTPLVTAAVDSIVTTYRRLDAEKQKEYGEKYLEAVCDSTRLVTEGSWDPKNVVDVLVHASTGTRPRPQYVIGLDAKCSMLPLSILPPRVLDFLAHNLLIAGLKPAGRDRTPAKAQ